jgi:hypothetical protein
MKELSYPKKVIGALIAAAVGVPAIAMGYYYTYQLVTYLGN